MALALALALALAPDPALALACPGSAPALALACPIKSSDDRDWEYTNVYSHAMSVLMCRAPSDLSVC